MTLKASTAAFKKHEMTLVSGSQEGVPLTVPPARPGGAQRPPCYSSTRCCSDSCLLPLNQEIAAFNGQQHFQRLKSQKIEESRRDTEINPSLFFIINF